MQFILQISGAYFPSNSYVNRQENISPEHAHLACMQAPPTTKRLYDSLRFKACCARHNVLLDNTSTHRVLKERAAQQQTRQK